MTDTELEDTARLLLAARISPTLLAGFASMGSRASRIALGILARESESLEVRRVASDWIKTLDAANSAKAESRTVH